MLQYWQNSLDTLLDSDMLQDIARDPLIRPLVAINCSWSKKRIESIHRITSTLYGMSTHIDGSLKPWRCVGRAQSSLSTTQKIIKKTTRTLLDKLSWGNVSGLLIEAEPLNLSKVRSICVSVRAYISNEGNKKCQLAMQSIAYHDLLCKHSRQ